MVHFYCLLHNRSLCRHAMLRREEHFVTTKRTVVQQTNPFLTSRPLFCSIFQECDFVKSKDNTYLRVVYMGNLRITGSTNCCKRWYFTFNNKTCAIPAAIDGSIYQSHNLNIHRPTNIEGYCGGIAKGKVKVEFKIKAGECGGGYNYCDAWTGWNMANRIIIEEVDPPVAQQRN